MATRREKAAVRLADAVLRENKAREGINMPRLGIGERDAVTAYCASWRSTRAERGPATGTAGSQERPRDTTRRSVSASDRGPSPGRRSERPKTSSGGQGHEQE